MRAIFHILACFLVLLLASGCSYFYGVMVAFRPEASATARRDLQELLSVNGYQISRQDGDSIIVYQHDRHGLRAIIGSHEGGTSFTIGKINHKNFSDEEIAQVDMFARWLVSHSESILHGHASKACTTEQVRKQFYQKIPKR
jgi:hypothetical protein